MRGAPPGAGKHRVKVAVTGGTGFIGSHTAAAFVNAGHALRLLVRDREKVRRVFDAHQVGIPENEVVVGDIADPGAVERLLEGVDAVFHAAALVDMRKKSALAVLETGARGFELVVGGAVRRGLPSILYVSSLSIFFRPGGPPLHPDLPIPQADGAYARSKADAERAVRRMQEQGASLRVSYPCGVAGPLDPGLSDANHAIYSLLKDTGVDTQGGFQLVDVRDLAQLHLALLGQPPGPQRHIAAGDMLSWQDTYALFDSLTGLRMRRIPIPGPMLRTLGSIGDGVKRIVDFNYPLTRSAMELATLWPGADGAPTTRATGVAFRPIRETYRDTLRWLYESGRLGAKHVGRLAEGR